MFIFGKDYTADLGTRADPGPAFLVCLSHTADPAAWPYPLPYSAAVLFEGLPGTFTFEELAAAGERLGLSSTRCVEHQRTWERLDIAKVEGERICKTGQKLYF